MTQSVFLCIICRNKFSTCCCYTRLINECMASQFVTLCTDIEIFLFFTFPFHFSFDGFIPQLLKQVPKHNFYILITVHVCHQFLQHIRIHPIISINIHMPFSFHYIKTSITSRYQSTIKFVNHSYTAILHGISIKKLRCVIFRTVIHQYQFPVLVRLV